MTKETYENILVYQAKKFALFHIFTPFNISNAELYILKIYI
jgi:hypothetical protein